MEAKKGEGSHRRRISRRVELLPVERIRPEEGLGRKRDRQGHEELCRSIALFGVLTPVTVRRAGNGSGEYLLVKGQGRTLACRVLGIPSIPAIVVDASFSENEKVQQFLVENVARLRMKPVDRALLISNARKSGEETAAVARRFGISASTVRRLESQLEGAGPAEIAALRSGSVSLASQAVIARFADGEEREALATAVSSARVSASELETLLVALGWSSLVNLGPSRRIGRVRLIEWACKTLADLPRGQAGKRLWMLAARFPASLAKEVPQAMELFA